MGHRIIICDDEEGMRRYLTKMLGGWGYGVAAYASPLEMLRVIKEADPPGDLLLLDIKMPEMEGIEVLNRVKKALPEMPVIMMTGHGTIESAVEAMKLGAYDYMTKPFPQEKLSALVRNALEQKQLREENLQLKKELQDRQLPNAPVFVSRRFGEVYQLALRVAESHSSVLVLGESGTGKELIAAAVHYHSPRAQNRFVAINCAALSETLLESQLFGHVKGAFTGAVQAQKGLLDEADGGTLFLDEVGDVSAALQAKLLRVLQEGEFIPVGATRPRNVDVRFVAATNKDLEKEVAEGNFREDLYYRLNVIALDLPPLRERPEDLEPLAEHFLVKSAAKTGHRVRGISQEALRAMRRYHWPGNVRELENVIERGVILARDEEIGLDALPLKVSEPGQAAGTESGPVMSLRAAERIQVIRGLRQTRWHKSRTAELLGITRKTLDRKIKEFGLRPDDGEPAE
ncbi:MAG: sigma-54-dependent Fis family transcriptional regulator [Desulfuromonas sp.]|uniref:sigma-54-dependent transcriptional regulator n=1 Tax=Desulfuromonas sp. TaxID=892 RepID=UPI000CC0AA76|nr:sigma-54 dependent transcriptional regulator [Desulfuromonas sp.]PLX83465.1 MAG: sigma-54-dependent Fis family transcriptional regulator [Desulfuromonas sp.]